jgi:hypothetical protein
MLGMVDSYYKIKDTEKALDLAKAILKNTCQDLDYLTSLEKPFSNYLQYEKQVSIHILSELIRITNENGDKKLSAAIQQNLETYGMALRKSM